MKILEKLWDNDPEDKNYIVRIKEYFQFWNHLCLTFEMLNMNLYEHIKLHNFEGFEENLVWKYVIQILKCLKYLSEFWIIHCDLKPENILLWKAGKTLLKVIDFGSSCYEKEKVYTYIQSWYYRAPEVILGIPYTTAIDMWSLGCIAYELFVGFPMFAGENEKM